MKLIIGFSVIWLILQTGLIARHLVTCERLFGGIPSCVSADGSVITMEDGETLYRWENGEFELIPEMTHATDISNNGKVISGYKVNSETNLAYWYIWRYGHLVPVVDYPVLSSSLSGNGKVAVAIRNTFPPNFLRYQIGFFQEISSPFGGTPIPSSVSYNGDIIVGNDTIIGGFYLSNDIWTALNPLPGDDYCRVSDVSDDGLIMVGNSMKETIHDSRSCYWENGIPHPLESLDEDLILKGASQVSGDGTVVLGGESSTLLLGVEPILWRREHSWTPRYLRNVIASTDINSDVSQWIFSRCILSRDGSTIIVTAQTPENGEESFRIRMCGMFGNYNMNEGFAETGNWMGCVYALCDPWIWCENVPCWLNIPEETAIAEQGWVYAPDQEELWIVPIDGTNWGYSFSLEKWLYITNSGWMYMP